MTFGERIRALRREKRFTLRDLAARVGVGFTYLSKIENHKLDDGHGASEALIRRLAIELNADENELMTLAEKVPEPIRRRVLARPDAFRVLASLTDDELNDLVRRANLINKQRAALVISLDDTDRHGKKAPFKKR